MLYTRLDFLSYEIRLLNIQEAPYNESIHCTLEQTTLLDPGSYHALSYCWGDSEERGLQIRLMRQIYSQAIFVISWLGDDPDDIASAAKYLFENGSYKWFPSRRRTATDFGSFAGGRNTEEIEEWVLQRWRIFQIFFEMSYWRRVWVIQEIASSDQVKVFFGDIVMDWKSITSALDHFKEHSDKVPKACASYEYAAELNHIRTRFKGPQQMTLIEAMQCSRYALATDPKDKIYALLGLTSDGSRLVPMPNYRKAHKQIFYDLFKAMLLTAESSDAASMNFLACSANGWPWRDAKSLQLWSELNTILGSPFCSLNPTFSHVPMERAPNSKLQTQGILLGQVCQMSSSPLRPKEFTKVPTSEGYIANWQRLKITPDILGLYPSGIPNAILQTLYLGSSVTGIDAQFCLNNLWSRKGQKGVPVHKREQWDVINRWFHLNSLIEIGSSTLQQWSQLNSKTNRLQHLLHGSSELFSYTNFPYCIERIDKVLQSQMCFMVTQAGLVGMAPPTTQIGDWVCYIKGVDIPTILREKENGTDKEYLVVGGAYAHMDRKLPGSGRFGDWAETYFMDVAGYQSIILG